MPIVPGRDKASEDWIIVKEFAFGKAVEAVLFTKDASELIIAVREDNCLHYVNVETLQVRLKSPAALK